MPLLFLCAALLSIAVDQIFDASFAASSLVDVAVGIGFALCVIAQYILIKSQRARVTRVCDQGVCLDAMGTGPYKYSRHPKYGAYLIFLIGIGFIFNTWIALVSALLLLILCTWVIIPYQEKILSKLHDKDYATYREQVPMWV